MSNIQSRFALIIASDYYTDKKLSQLKAPIVDANRLSELLQSIDGGYEVTILSNKESYVIKKEIEHFFRKAKKNDLLLLYFAGHGHKSIEDGLLYLATRDSELEILDSTTIPAQFIDSMMHKSKSSRIVLILDCCYSGAFPRGLSHRAEDKILNVKDEFRESGSVILTSASAMQFSWEGNELKKEQGTSDSTSFYTNLLIKGIESGEADLDKDNSITCNELNEYIKQKMKEIGHPQNPQIYINKGDITIAKKQVIEKSKHLPPLPEVYWKNLLYSIYRGECIPFIGDLVFEYFNQIDDYAFLTREEITKELAEKYDYPFKSPYQLQKVAQYLAIEQGDDLFPKTYISDRLKKMKPPNFSSDVFSKSPHAILAELNLPIYITTNYDLLLEETLKSQGKEPVSEFCLWNEQLVKNKNKGIIPYFKRPTKEYPSSKKPLVFHFYGSIDYPESMVLTERDYLNFVIFTNNSDFEKVGLNPILRTVLTKFSLLFIGYYIGDVNFDSIFQGALSFMSTITKNRNNIATISVPSINTDIIKQEKALQHLRKKASYEYQIDVHWIYSNQFINELQTKFTEYKTLNR